MTQNPNTIILVEHDKLYREDAPGADKDKSLKHKEFEGLKNYLLSRSDENGKAPLLVRENYLKATNYVGAIITDEGTRIEIFPKIDFAGGKGEEKDPNGDPKERVRILIEMLRPYLGGHHRQFEKGTWENEELPLLEAFIQLFLRDVQSIVHRGLARTYIRHEDNIPCLKGKLDFTNHLRYNLFHKERFYVTFDEFSIDRPINRVIKRALREVIKIAKFPANYKMASQLLAYFEEVKDPRDWRHEVKISKTDRNVNSTAYEDAFSLAQLILRELSPDNWSGERRTISLLFPMEKVFECYVAAKLREIVSRDVEVKEQDSKYKVMEEVEGGESFTIKPDIVVRYREYCVILDTKWKTLDSQSDNQSNKYGISQSDIYQLYSYAKVYEKKEANRDKISLVLLYPRSEIFPDTREFAEDANTKRDKHNLSLKIVPVDIKGLTSKDGADRRVAEGNLLKQSFSNDLYQIAKGKFKESA